MNVKENLTRLCEQMFWSNLKIPNFNKKFCPTPYLFLCSYSGIGLEITVHTNSILTENKDYIVISIKEYLGKHEIAILPTLTCFINILDVDGNKMFPRTIDFQCSSNKSETSSSLRYSVLFSEERYIKKSSILNNASEFLQENTLTIAFEGTLREWLPPTVGIYFEEVIHNYSPRILTRNDFIIKEFREGIEVSLPENSTHIQCLIENSDSFSEMYNIPIKQNSKEEDGINHEIFLKNEELPAFLCMLVFIKSRNLILHKATVSDMYKIADKYGVIVLLKECRNIIIKMLSKDTASKILKFAHFYYDKELEEATESYLKAQSHEGSEVDEHFKTVNEFDDSFNTDSVCSDAIKSETDFVDFLQHLEKQLQSVHGNKFSKGMPELMEIHFNDKMSDTEVFDFHK